METILLTEFGRKGYSIERIRESSFGYQLAESKERQKAVGFGFGELLSAEVDLMYLLIAHFHLDEGAIQTGIDDKGRLVRTRRD